MLAVDLRSNLGLSTNELITQANPPRFADTEVASPGEELALWTLIAADLESFWKRASGLGPLKLPQSHVVSISWRIGILKIGGIGGVCQEERRVQNQEHRARKSSVYEALKALYGFS